MFSLKKLLAAAGKHNAVVVRSLKMKKRVPEMPRNASSQEGNKISGFGYLLLVIFCENSFWRNEIGLSEALQPILGCTSDDIRSGLLASAKKVVEGRTDQADGVKAAPAPSTTSRQSG